VSGPSDDDTVITADIARRLMGGGELYREQGASQQGFMTSVLHAARRIDDDEVVLVRGSNHLHQLCPVIADRWVGNARSRRAVYPTPCARPDGRTG
jgi:hypothetical protein